MTIQSGDVEPDFVSHTAFDHYADDYEHALNKGVALSGEFWEQSRRRDCGHLKPGAGRTDVKKGDI
jgi:hypothetical protein